MRCGQRYYLSPHEEDPIRKGKNKRFIPKVMFFAAVARPRFIASTHTWFDGKLGIWAFVYQAPAQRTSKNRVAGTIETKCTKSINGGEYKKMMLDKLLPAIKEKWPNQSDRIEIQEDGATPHSAVGRTLMNERALEDYGLDVTVVKQPPNSPQFNALDAGVFNSMEKNVWKESARNLDELIAAVNTAYDKLDRITLDNVWLSVQGSMEDCLRVDGDNRYPLRHMGKAKLRREGRIPISIKVDPLLIARGQKLLDERPAIAPATAPTPVTTRRR